MLKEQGKEAILIYMDEIRPEHMNNYSEPEILSKHSLPKDRYRWDKWDR